MERKLIRWLHLSDFHVGKDGYAQRRIFPRIHAHVRERVEAEGAPDLVFITGDLANKGKAAEYKEFYDEFLMPLQLEALGDGWEGKVFTIPGNHDVDRSVAQYADREKMCRPEARIFDGNDEGLREREIQLLPRFGAYAESEASEGSDSPDGWLTSAVGAFGESVAVGGSRLGIVGINTAWLCEDEHDQHRLTPGLALLEAALAAVRECDACIVLGHHPLDWLHHDHQEQLRAMFGEHGALYLHGHLHESRGRREDGAGRGFLAIQSGACFQARDGEPWVNGLLWAELDLDQKQLRLQPRHWNHRNRDWPLTAGAFPERWRRDGSDVWCLPLPGTRKEKQVGRAGTVDPPEGWRIVDREFLDGERKALSDADALRFFDGSVPGWRLALAEEIPRRKVVETLTSKIHATPLAANLPTVALLVGPGGEGKSTAVLQTAAALVDGDPLWKVLWREDEDRALTAKDVHDLPTGAGERWLIATDDADLIATELFEVVKRLRVRGDVAGPRPYGRLRRGPRRRRRPRAPATARFPNARLLRKVPARKPGPGRPGDGRRRGLRVLRGCGAHARRAVRCRRPPGDTLRPPRQLQLPRLAPADRRPQAMT